MTTATDQRKSYMLAVSPIDYSLTAGTDIPPPPDSPTMSQPSLPANASASPPLADTMPSQPGPHQEPPSNGQLRSEEHNSVSTTDSTTNNERADSFRTPMSPASASKPAPQDAKHERGKVRRLFSLNSLRSSFSSSRSSLQAPRATDQESNYGGRPESRSAFSTTGSAMHSAQSSMRGDKKSGSWFKRKSGFFTKGQDGTLDVVNEDYRPDTTESNKRLKPMMLPEIGNLKGGELNDGNLGWDANDFKR